MDLILFSLYMALMGALSFLIAEETSLYIQARRGELRNTSIDVEKPRDFKASILPLVVALVLAIIVFIIIFLLPPPPPCTNTTVCNYLMSIM
jgi:hypothetical protein